MKKILFSILLYFGICSVNLYGDEFVINKFSLDAKDLSARTYPVTDVNDEFCALIKIRSDLDNIKFYSSLLDNVIDKGNEYWLYVSPGIQYLEIAKDGFITLSYTIQKKVESANVYIMELTNKDQTRVMVISRPAESLESDILINGVLQEFKTPHLFKIDPGKYYVTVQHPKFIEMTQEITLNELDKKDLIFNLTLYEGSDLQKYHFSKKYKKVGWLSSASLLAIGITCNYLAENAYEKSNNATSTKEADNYWDEYELYKNTRNITYSVSILPFVYGSYNWIKELKHNKKLK